MLIEGLCYYQLGSLQCNHMQSSGYKQSTHAGKKILQQLERFVLPPVVAIYSSPTARTMGTAAAIAKEVGLSQVLPAYGLNCCAAAKMTGAGGQICKMIKGQKGPRVQSSISISDPSQRDPK